MVVNESKFISQFLIVIIMYMEMVLLIIMSYNLCKFHSSRNISEYIKTNLNKSDDGVLVQREKRKHVLENNF